MTGVHVSELDRLKGYKVGAVDYVSIPVVPEILRSKVAVLIELFTKRRELQELNRTLAQANERLAAGQHHTAGGKDARAGNPQPGLATGEPGARIGQPLTADRSRGTHRGSSWL